MIPTRGVSDFALQWDSQRGSADLALVDDDLSADAGLRTATLMSLFLDRRALDGDPLPAEDGDQRGWWGDEFAEVDGDLIGSRMWLLERAKRTEDVVPRAEELVREALAWMLEDRVASSLDVAVEATGDLLAVAVTVYRPTGDTVSFRFAHVWAGEAAAAEAS